MDHFKDLILDALERSPIDWRTFVPANHMPLAQWRETTRRLEAIIRDEFENPEFCFTSGEAMAAYKLPLTGAAEMIDHKLRFEEFEFEEGALPA